MGNYTELDIKVTLTKDPNKIAEFMKAYPFLTDSRNPKPDIDHPFFNCERAPGFFNKTDGSIDPYHSINLERQYDNELDLGVCLKNYNDEIDLFLEWLHPYTIPAKSNDVGNFRYEEDEEYKAVIRTDTGFEIRKIKET